MPGSDLNPIVPQAGKSIETVRRIRDEIEAKVRAMLDGMGIASPGDMT